MAAESSTRKTSKKRKGAAIVEFALFLPLFFMITMATIETCRVLYLRQSLTIAAYECARLGVIPGMSLEALEFQCDAIVDGRNIRNVTLKVDPPDLSSLHYGEPLTVTVETKADDNAMLGTWFYRGRTLRETVVILGEY